jgi:hypothetical protein
LLLGSQFRLFTSALAAALHPFGTRQASIVAPPINQSTFSFCVGSVGSTVMCYLKASLGKHGEFFGCDDRHQQKYQPGGTANTPLE